MSNFNIIIRTIGICILFAVLIWCTGCSMQVNVEPVACTASSAEAGGDISQCSADVRAASTNPLILSCGEPTVTQVGKGMLCSQGVGNTWCCIPDPCAAFNDCATVEGSTLLCLNGVCSCTLPTHSGENSPASCNVDGTGVSL